jgi:hypothetical protein
MFEFAVNMTREDFNHPAVGGAMLIGLLPIARRAAIVAANVRIAMGSWTDVAPETARISVIEDHVNRFCSFAVPR